MSVDGKASCFDSKVRRLDAVIIFPHSHRQLMPLRTILRTWSFADYTITDYTVSHMNIVFTMPILKRFQMTRTVAYGKRKASWEKCLRYTLCSINVVTMVRTSWRTNYSFDILDWVPNTSGGRLLLMAWFLAGRTRLDCCGSMGDCGQIFAGEPCWDQPV